MAAKSKQARPVRKKKEFDVRALIARLEAMKVTAGAYSWELADIQAARNAQMAGQFKLPARLAESFRTDDAMYVAHRNRLAPQRSIPVTIKPARETAAGLAIAKEAEALFGKDGCGIAPETMVELNSQLANHGVAFGINLWTTREDGSRTDVELHAWPIEHVRWNAQRRVDDGAGGTRVDPGYVTAVDPESDEAALLAASGGTRALGEIPIDHGDGRWVVIKARELEPFKDCCVLPGALVWARHAFGWRDLGKGSAAHGNAKVIGEMAPGIGTKDQDGSDFLELMRLIASGDSPYGIMPSGYKVQYLVNNSAAWQIFVELISKSEISASRIYIGQDGSLGTNGTGPGIDLRALFGVTDDIVEGDLHALERGIKTGTIDPWAAVNFTDSSLAPQRLYDIPDADEDEAAASYGERMLCFERDVEALERRFVVDQPMIQKLADRYKVDAPTLKSVALPPTTPGAAPTALPAPPGPAPALPAASPP